MIYKIESLNTSEILVLGQRGENLANTIQIDMTAWQAEWPNATFNIIAVRPEEGIPYPVNIIVSGNMLLWQVTDVDTGIAGIGRMEIQAVEGEKLRKSAIVVTKVCSCILGDGEDIGDPPPAGSSWMSELVKLESSVKNSVSQVEAMRETISVESTKTLEDISKAQQAVEAAQSKADQSLVDITEHASREAQRVIETIPEDYTELAENVDNKAAAIEMVSPRAAYHELQAQEGPISATLYGQTTETGTGEKSPENPYTISGVEAARVQACGKNLLDVGSKTITQSYRYNLSIPLKPGEYTVSALVTSSGTDSDVSGIFFYGAGGKQVAVARLARDVRANAVVNFASEVVQLLFCAENNVTASANDTATWADIQIEAGSVATAYEPYNANVINVPLLPDGSPLHGNGTVDDEVCNDAASGCDKSYTFDGSELFYAYNVASWNGHVVVFTNRIQDLKHGTGPFTNYIKRRAYADVYNDEYAAIHANLPNYFYMSFSCKRLGIGNTTDGATGIAAIKAYLAANPLTVFYRSTEYTPDKDLRVCKVVRRSKNVTFNSVVSEAASYPGLFLLEEKKGYGESSLDDKCNIFGVSNEKWAALSDLHIRYISYSDARFKWSAMAGNIDGVNAYLAEHPIEITLPLITPEVYMTDPVVLRKPSGLDTVTITGSGETAVEYQHDTKGYVDKLGERVTAVEEVLTKALPTDDTLSVAGRAADAKATGDKFASVDADIAATKARLDANVFMDASAKAASHELYAEDGDMHVTLYGETTETGSGDKSPDNPYTISGVENAVVQAGSKNLCKTAPKTMTYGGVTMTIDKDGKFTMSGTSTSAAGRGAFFTELIYLPPGRYTVSFRSDSAVLPNLYAQYDDGLRSLGFTVGGAPLVFITNEHKPIRIAFNVNNGHVYDGTEFYIMLNPGNTALPYEPYNANTADLPLMPDGAPLMGNGMVMDAVENDVASGCDKRIVLDGSETWYMYTTSGVNRFTMDVQDADLQSEAYSDRFAYNYMATAVLNSIWIRDGKTLAITHSSASVDEWKAYLAANPLTVYYRSTEYTPDKDLRVCKTKRAIRTLRLVDLTWSLAGTNSAGMKAYYSSISSAPPINKDQAICNVLPISNNYQSSTPCAYVGTDYNGRAWVVAPGDITGSAGLKEWLTDAAVIVYHLATPKVYMTDPLPLRKPNGIMPATVTGSGETAVEYPHEHCHLIRSLMARIGSLEATVTQVPST